MDITCDKCQRKFTISDDKIPLGKTASFLCPKCKSKITVTSGQMLEDTGFDFSDDEGPDFPSDDTGGDDYEADDSPFEFAEEEGKTALICEADQSLKDKIIKPVLEFMEYHITEVDSERNAIKKMRYHDYDMLVVNDEFDSKSPESNGVMVYLERLEMITRRNIYVIMLTKRFRTMDNMMTLHNSTNLIVNMKDINDFDKILGRGLSDYEIFYRVFKESMKNIGII
jgi:hypothetical protein